jgi:CBS domain-containing protein
MKKITVKELMVPLPEYATVPQDATLFEAVLALEEAQKKFDQSRERHRAILVLDKKKHVVGKLSQLDVLKGLEPNYGKIGDFRGSSRLGFSPDFLKSLLETHALWQKPLHDLCKRAGQIKVEDIMYAPSEGEYVREDASLDEAVHQLIVGHHQSLLVTRGKEIVGVLRLGDVFGHVCELIKTCEI